MGDIKRSGDIKLLFSIIPLISSIPLSPYNMTETTKLNICRPGHNASCALCCGSHNYAGTREEIDTLFDRRRHVLGQYSPAYLLNRMKASRSDMTGSYYFNREHNPDFIITLPKLYEDGLQCPFVSRMDGSGIIGCAVYPGGQERDLRFECFQNYTCKYFSCQARDILEDREIGFAARLMGDWYYYTLLIHSFGLLRELQREYGTAASVPPVKLEQVKEALEKALREEKDLHTLSSYFS